MKDNNSNNNNTQNNNSQYLMNSYYTLVIVLIPSHINSFNSHNIALEAGAIIFPT